MNKLFWTLILLLLPALGIADDGSLSFAPPASDYSVVFLGNLFGVVDGVLHGTGSQIMGMMFGVFNSAVLAIGGIIIMYTLMVSTMNTAHEGQMLGQKWSSIWIPVRSTMGLALLIPKASGYCLMQIMVMWIVVQGVGAADKIWDAALGYLNRGGVIIQAQANPIAAKFDNISSGVASGAGTILTGQVCMLGLYKQLQNQRQMYLNAKQTGTGPCAGTPSAAMLDFCNTAVPDFVGTVNVVSVQKDTIQNKKDAKSFNVNMPNFDPTSKYSFLNGICGTIHWNALDDISKLKEINLSSGELDTASMSRAIAIQQMYVDLAAVAQVIVNNNPYFINSDQTNTMANINFSPVAIQQFGIPYTSDRVVCTNSLALCTGWGVASGSTGSALFNGTEFQGAMSDYTAIMKPTLNLIREAKNAQDENASRDFIANASAQGWLMAGSYFFDLVRLNGNALDDADSSDSNTGMDSSKFDIDALTQPFGDGTCQGDNALLCTWFNQDKSKIQQIVGLINGDSPPPALANPVLAKPNLSNIMLVPPFTPSVTVIDNMPSSTVYSFINNSQMMTQPSQPGLKFMDFSSVIHFNFDTSVVVLQNQNFDCGGFKIGLTNVCIGRFLGNLFYNAMFKNLVSIILSIFKLVVSNLITTILILPIMMMSQIFMQAQSVLTMPGVNPVVALANMGIMYVNYASNAWMGFLAMSAVAAAVSSMPTIGSGLMIFAGFLAPLLVAYLGTMIAIGFTTAYYIPILPYMIFTFGSIAWFISVIEAMVAAPIVALGVTHPEGHDAFGKGEAAIMILMNVFLRPAMMIIGYIAAISLSYVGIWVLNAGFNHAIAFMQPGPNVVTNWGDPGHKIVQTAKGDWNSFTHSFGSNNNETAFTGPQANQTGNLGTERYLGWAGMYAFFFAIVSYTMMYLTIVQKAFSLIVVLPDRVLRWIGGQPESAGQEAMQWTEETKGTHKEAGKAVQDAGQQIGKSLGAKGAEMMAKKPGKVGGENTESKPETPPESKPEK